MKFELGKEPHTADKTNDITPITYLLQACLTTTTLTSIILLSKPNHIKIAFKNCDLYHQARVYTCILKLAESYWYEDFVKADNPTEKPGRLKSVLALARGKNFVGIQDAFLARRNAAKEDTWGMLDTFSQLRIWELVRRSLEKEETEATEFRKSFDGLDYPPKTIKSLRS